MLELFNSARQVSNGVQRVGRELELKSKEGCDSDRGKPPVKRIVLSRISKEVNGDAVGFAWVSLSNVLIGA